MDWFLPVPRFFWEGESPPGWRELSRRIYDCELVYLSQGAFRIRIGDTLHRLERGAVLIVPPATWHESWTEPGESAMRHCLHFDWTPECMHRPAPLQTFFGKSFDDDRVHPVPAAVAPVLPLVTATSNHPGLESVLNLMFAGLRRKEPMGAHLLWPVLRQLSRPGRPERQENPSRLGDTLYALKQYIDIHYPEPIGYREFRNLTRLSTSHLCRSFGDWLGSTPTAYLNDLRLQHARRLLSDSRLSVKEIARAVGIPNANYFARLFRRKFHVSPTEAGRISDSQ